MGPGTIALDEAEVIRRTLYRRDEMQRARILDGYRGVLTAEDIASYQEQGYLAMEGVLAPDEVEAAKAALSDLIARPDLAAGGVQVQIEPFYRDGQVDERVADPELRGLVERLLAAALARARVGGGTRGRGVDSPL
jgi:hypothetical protein